MNRNTESQFSLAPQVNIDRSTFSRDSTVKTSFNVGDVVPFYLDEVLPGDTFNVKTSKLCRMQTLKTPMMDDLFLDTYYFFVPNRLVWNHWREFMGENNDSAWIPTVEYSIPLLNSPSGGWNVGTIADYLGIPIGVDSINVNALPFRAYALICNEWFRDENLLDPLVIEKGDSQVIGTNGTNVTTDVAKGGYPFKAAKVRDYFTSCLPSPQKGPDVTIGSRTASKLPVYTTSLANDYFYDATTHYDDYKAIVNDSSPVLFEIKDAPQPTGGEPDLIYPKLIQTDTAGMVDTTWDIFELNSGASTYHTQMQGASQVSPDVENFAGVKVGDGAPVFRNNHSGFVPVNLVADGTHLLSVASINELRQAFQIQRFYEKCARGGTRYVEILKSHFGVTSPDARMQRPEYLGGNRLPLNVKQVTQTSATQATQPLGDVAGMSVTTDTNSDFQKSFTEHGYVIGVMCARYRHTYQNGLDRTFSRKTKFDYYWPVFAHLGEQAVYNREIYLTGNSTTDRKVFGYQEAWADYRYKPNRVTGMMRSASLSGLDSWHLADDYQSLPYLSADWISEDATNVDRVLTVASSNSHQIFADIYVQNKTTRAMPLYSIPGLIDHF